jgi:hypothetical protein
LSTSRPPTNTSAPPNTCAAWPQRRAWRCDKIDAPAYFAWIKDLAKSGEFEFWNHSLVDAADRFSGAPLEQQKEEIGRTQRLAREKPGRGCRFMTVSEWLESQAKGRDAGPSVGWKGVAAGV